MKASDIDFLKDQLIPMFIKFSGEKRHLESLQAGNLLMNNLGYFKKLEEKTGIKGRGDVDEASLAVKEAIIEF
ncbi:hypothetical protein QJQ58_08165 [Paenibacillus dendritiformis]|uniref:hypothetical protein n=1 Tax=Paenibacillus dendritiformis TaxID=130049 RepID=UPI00248ACB56|nr:hypothetical protein [Paenibacillus dendritiformis]WGU96201.1 hypothetical protein QJQ58_08165 [Paenibacillus dendritiformis]